MLNLAHAGTWCREFLEPGLNRSRSFFGPPQLPHLGWQEFMSFAATDRPEQSPDGLNVAQTLRQYRACGVVLVGDDSNLSLLTPETASLLGLQASEAPNPPMSRLPARLASLVEEVRTSGQPREAELDLSPSRRISVRAHLLPDSAAKTSPAVVLVLNDLTPANKLEQALAQLNRLASLGTLSATMAHEIRNALVAGKTMVDLLLEKNQDAELAGIVRRELTRIDAIVNGMLKLSKGARSPLRPLHLHEVLGHSLRLIGPRLNHTSLTLEQSLSAAADLVQGSENELQQAVVNLLLNAMDAMGPEGTLTVKTESVQESREARRETKEPARIRLTIRDTGPGIPQENQARLFEPFFTTKSSGTGLGLAITQRIVQEHQGQITVESRPGAGAAFHILLPLLPQKTA
jgi:signal transduction histidine kinase